MTNQESRRVNEGFSVRTDVSKLDALVGPEAVYMSDQERLAAKLEMVMKDPDVVRAIGAYMTQLILPGNVAQGTLTEEQATRVRDTLVTTLDSQLTPEGRARVNRETDRYMARYGTRPTPFGGR